VSSSAKIAGAGDETSHGTRQWGSESNITANDGAYASVSGVAGSNVDSYYLRATSFGFAIPTGSTINGIQLEIERKAFNNDADAHVHDAHVYLQKAGTITGADKANTVSTWTTSDVIASYGGAADIWSWSPAPTAEDINAATFGARLAVSLHSTGLGATVAYVDFMRITVTYTEPTGYTHTVSGVAAASISTVDGVATASISTVNGV